MHSGPHARLRSLQRTRGDQLRDLRLADRVVRLEGLDRELAAQLERRWGGFFGPAGSRRPDHRLTVYSSGPSVWVPRSEQVEDYRLELLEGAECAGAPPVVASYHFAICAADEPGTWRLALTDQDHEPVERVMDNALRYFTARVAVEAGGFALHAAGILRADRAYFFSGPSNAGKTTAVGLAGEVRSLGDDFALILRHGDAWYAPALPFDNSERAAAVPPSGLFPVAAIWRLHKADENRLDRPPRSLATASLMGCTAFPWAIPELGPGLLEHVEQFVADGRFAHLHFRKDRDLPASLFDAGDGQD